MLLEPEPHIPDVPDVSSIPEDVDIAGDVDVPAFDGVGIPGIGRVPGSTAAAGAEAPGVVPPPSYIALDPYISEGEVATVEHAVPLPVAGMEIVPAKPVGAGLTPADEISVEPNGIPVGELVEPIVMPSGEVAPIVGVGVTVPSNCPSTCAMAALQTTSAGRTAPNNENLISVLRLQTASPRRASITISLRKFRLMQVYRTLVNLSSAHEPSEISSGKCSISRLVPRPTSVVSPRTSKGSFAPLGSSEKLERGLWIAAERERSLPRRASW
jgi:hypothetical protein